MAKIHEYSGDSLVVRFDAKRCIHAAECVRGLPQVFDPEKRPWVSPDAAAPEAVVAVVDRCPTGALKAEWVGSSESPETPLDLSGIPRARLVEDGPIYVRGACLLKNVAGDTVVEDTRLALCRCGASKEKPFCDGSHTAIGFEAP